jgi:hypothetical protein
MQPTCCTTPRAHLSWHRARPAHPLLPPALLLLPSQLLPLLRPARRLLLLPLLLPLLLLPLLLLPLLLLPLLLRLLQPQFLRLRLLLTHLRWLLRLLLW